MTNRIAATGTVPAPPAALFLFLSDLENHWALADRFIEVLSLERPGDDPQAPAHGGRVRVRGPLGLRRTALTRVVAADEPRELRGTARLGESTAARVRWRLSPSPGGTRVELSAVVEEAGRLDRLLLRAGGRAWLERRFASVLARLAEGAVPPAAEARSADGEAVASVARAV